MSQEKTQRSDAAPVGGTLLLEIMNFFELCIVQFTVQVYKGGFCK